MAWKVEKWMEEVFPGEMKIFSEYEHLTRRELAIVGAGIMDLALAELISLRLRDYTKEAESFLGLDGDGRAPCASFGARIQLAHLLGIINEVQATILKAMKGIRNKFAHKINVNYTDADVKKYMIIMLDNLEAITQNMYGDKMKITSVGIRPYLEMTPEAGAGLLLAVMSIFQAYFHQMHKKLVRVGPAWKVDEKPGESKE